MQEENDYLHFFFLKSKLIIIIYEILMLAGVEGLEPPTPGFETGALPIELHSLVITFS